MKHIFDVNVAKEYGIEIAILLENMNFWLEKNRANSYKKLLRGANATTNRANTVLLILMF